MSEPFLAEVKIVAFHFAPRGFAFCDGQLLPINQNQSLFSLLGTSYGGDGITSFALPDLRGRVPVHASGNPGGGGGQEVSLASPGNMPSHTHALLGTESAANSSLPAGAVFAKPNGRRTVVPYGSGAGRAEMQPTGSTGAGSGVDNMQPSLAVRFCIALQGLFPSRN